MATHPDEYVGRVADAPNEPKAEALSNTRFRAAVTWLKALQFAVSRRILFLWVKPTVLGADREKLGLHSQDLVCYALPYRSIADLMVVDRAAETAALPRTVDPIESIAEDRAFFFLARPEGTLGRKSLRHQSGRMTRLIAHQSSLSGQSIKIVPVSIFWGHQPDREKSIFKLLLSEHWSATSGMKKFLAALFHPRHILVQFGEPIDLAELIQQESDTALRVRRLLRLLRVHFNKQRQAIIGPDLSHRRTLINTILESEGVRTAIEREARHNERQPGEVEKKAETYAQEIASDQSYRVIRFFDVLLTWLWNNLYGGIEINRVETVKQLAQSHEIIYIPCHRSHIDYLLLSFVLYHNGLTPPHIAAGRNLNLPVIGPLLRRAGAFFMRRSFQGDSLYKEVFDEYLHQMFTKGYSVEYFIEGTRSRTGRTLPPRTGMLRMTVRSFQKDSSKPIAFMPVYFGYERVLESATYMAELSGKDKRSESFFDIFRIFPSMRRQFGEVTVNFGEPVLLKEFLDETLVRWQEPASVLPQDLGGACQQLAETLAVQINSAVAVKPMNLIAVALLSTARQNIEEHHLLDQVERLRQIATHCAPQGTTITGVSPREMLEDAIEIIGLKRSEHQFGTIVSASPEQSINLTYNANNVVHVFAIPSLVARYIRTRTRARSEDIERFIGQLFAYLKAEMFLPWCADEVPALIQRVTDCLCELKVIVRDNNGFTPPPPESAEYNCLQDIASISAPTLERFSIVMALIRHTLAPSVRQLETTSIGIAEQLSVLYGINSPDFFDKALFSTFLTELRDTAVIDAELNPLEGFTELDRAVAQTLDADVRYNILQAVSTYRTKTS